MSAIELAKLGVEMIVEVVLVSTGRPMVEKFIHHNQFTSIIPMAVVLACAGGLLAARRKAAWRKPTEASAEPGPPPGLPPVAGPQGSNTNSNNVINIILRVPRRTTRPHIPHAHRRSAPKTPTPPDASGE